MPQAPNGRYVKAREAERLCGIGRRTLFRWAKEGQIQYLRPGGRGHWLFDINSITPQHHGASAQTENKEAVRAIYARVSTRKQLPDLQTQIDTLQAKYPDHIVFSDCASGLNFKRKGLQALLQLAFEGRLLIVRVAHRDRLCRFAYDLIEFILHKHGAKISVESNDTGPPSLERELAEDVISVITVFGGRLYGARSAGRRKTKQASEEVRGPPTPYEEGGGSDGTETQEALPETGDPLGWADADLQGLDATHISTEGGTDAVLRSGSNGIQSRKRARKSQSKLDIHRGQEALGDTHQVPPI